MIIKHKDELSESFDFLDNLSYINHNTYNEECIPIQRNSNINKDLIHLESLMRYSESCDIDDGGVAIANICNTNKLDLSYVGFVVNEASILYDDDILEFSKILKENGYPVYISQEPRNSIYIKQLKEALSLDEGYDGFKNSIHLLSFCEEFGDSVKNAVTPVVNHVANNVNNVKEFFTASPKRLAQKLSSIKSVITAKTEQLKKATGSIRVSLMQQIDKLKSAYNSIKEKLVNSKSKKE